MRSRHRHSVRVVVEDAATARQLLPFVAKSAVQQRQILQRIIRCEQTGQRPRRQRPRRLWLHAPDASTRALLCSLSGQRRPRRARAEAPLTVNDAVITAATADEEVTEAVVETDDAAAAAEARRRAADLREPIEELDLSVRVYNLLKREGINSIAELVVKTEADLLDIVNFGQKAIDEVKMKLRVLYDLTLGMTLPDEFNA